MDGIYWESDSFSDLDGSWSPSSSMSHYSDQENYPHHQHQHQHQQQQQQQQVQHDNVTYYVQPVSTAAQEILDISGAISQAYGTYCEQTSQAQTNEAGDQILTEQSGLLQPCPQNQVSPASSSGSSGSKKTKNPVKRVHQRNAANMRERRRMKTINDAFEGLRERIPLASGDRKLSKVDTLRLAIRYIHQLTDMVSTSGASQSSQGRDHEAAKVIIRYHNSGYPDPYSEGLYAQEQFPLYGHSLSWHGHHKQMAGCPENKMAAKVWTPQIASNQDLEEMQSYVS